MTKNERGLTIPRPDSLSRFFGKGRFEDIFDSFWKDLSLDMRAFVDLQPKGSFPKVNVVETDEEYEVEIALAGFDKDQLALELKDNCLLIKTDKKEESESTDRKYLMKEISSRSFRRMLKFPAKVDPKNIDCNFENGIVTCKIGKVHAECGDPIQIKID